MSSLQQLMMSNFGGGGAEAGVGDLALLNYNLFPIGSLQNEFSNREKYDISYDSNRDKFMMTTTPMRDTTTLNRYGYVQSVTVNNDYSVSLGTPVSFDVAPGSLRPDVANVTFNPTSNYHSIIWRDDSNDERMNAVPVSMSATGAMTVGTNIVLDSSGNLANARIVYDSVADRLFGLYDDDDGNDYLWGQVLQDNGNGTLTPFTAVNQGKGYGVITWAEYNPTADRVYTCWSRQNVRAADIGATSATYGAWQVMPINNTAENCACTDPNGSTYVFYLAAASFSPVPYKITYYTLSGTGPTVSTIQTLDWDMDPDGEGYDYASKVVTSFDEVSGRVLVAVFKQSPTGVTETDSPWSIDIHEYELNGVSGLTYIRSTNVIKDYYVVEGSTVVKSRPAGDLIFKAGGGKAILAISNPDGDRVNNLNKLGVWGYIVGS